MQSPKACIHKSGFSLIEILVVIALASFIGGLGIIIGMDVYRQNSFQSEERLLVSILSRARARAMNNIFESSHGIHIEQSGYTLFRGSHYSSSEQSNEFIPKNTALTISGADEIVFSQLSGNVNTPVTLMLSDASRQEIISINDEGRIDW